MNDLQANIALITELEDFTKNVESWLVSEEPLSEALNNKILSLHVELQQFDQNLTVESMLELDKLKILLEELQTRLLAERARIAENLKGMQDVKRANKAYRTVVIPENKGDNKH